jgi:hypothetical protein
MKKLLSCLVIGGLLSLGCGDTSGAKSGGGSAQKPDKAGPKGGGVSDEKNENLNIKGKDGK